MKIFTTTLNYQIETNGKSLKEIFEPWLEKRKLVDWTQQLYATEIINDNEILFERGRRSSKNACHILMRLKGDRLFVEMTPFIKSYIQAVLPPLGFFLVVIVKKLEWIYFLYSLGFAGLFFGVLVFSVHYEKGEVRNDIWQELHIRKIKFKEIKR